MNLLGPCVNPAEPGVQLLGVPDEALLVPIAQVLDALGVGDALVVHGAGLDEIALHAETRAVRLCQGDLRPMKISPEQAGLARSPLQTVKGGDPKENAQRLADVLKGRGQKAERDAVALNAGALLMTAGKAGSLEEGVALAADMLACGEPYRRLEALAEISRG